MSSHPRVLNWTRVLIFFCPRESYLLTRINIRLANQLKKQIRADVALLQRNSIIDYSLLMGVHKNPDDVIALRRAWCVTNHAQLERMYRTLQSSADGAFFQTLTFEQFCVHAYLQILLSRFLFVYDFWFFAFSVILRLILH